MNVRPEVDAPRTVVLSACMPISPINATSSVLTGCWITPGIVPGVLKVTFHLMDNQLTHGIDYRQQHLISTLRYHYSAKSSICQDFAHHPA
jgi:hypothetical protein